jgi:hypothetical protein
MVEDEAKKGRNVRTATSRTVQRCKSDWSNCGNCVLVSLYRNMLRIVRALVLYERWCAAAHLRRWRWQMRRSRNQFDREPK